MSKSISTSLRLVLQKLGAQNLKGKRPSREQIVSAAKDISNMSRKGADRNWGSKARPPKA